MVNQSEYSNSALKNKKQTPKTSEREMTSVEKAMIIAFFYCLRNITLVGEIIGEPWTTIKSFLARPSERQSLDNIPHSGHPPVPTQRQCCKIIWAAKSTQEMTRSDFQDKYAAGISLSTGNN